MKNIYHKLLVISIVLFAVAGCEDFEDPNIDFSNSLPQYVEFSSGADIEGVEGDTVSATVRMREAQDQDITVSYEVSGDLSVTGTVVIAQGNLSGTFGVVIPENNTLGTGGSALLSISAVDNGLDIGRGGPEAGFSTIERTINWVEDEKVLSLSSNLIVDTLALSEAGLDTIRFIVSSVNPADSSSITVDSDISVDYTISGDLTGGGVDYTLLSSNPVIIEEGTSQDTIAILIAPGFDNAALDGTRSFFLELDAISGGGSEASLATNQALGRNFEDDTREVTVDGTSTVSGTEVVSIPVAISDVGFDHAPTAVVNYSITGGTAGVDYNDLSGGSIAFVLETTEEILIEVLNNNADATLVITLDAVDDPEGAISASDNTFTIDVENAP